MPTKNHDKKRGFRPVQLARRGINNTFTINSQEAERKERHLHMASGKQDRPNDVASEPQKDPLKVRVLDSIGGITPWDDTRTPARRQELGKHRVKGAILGALALTATVYAAIGIQQGVERVVDRLRQPQALSQEDTSPFGGAPASEFANSERFRRATANYLESTGRTPAGNNNTVTYTITGPDDVAWNLSLDTTDGDPRPGVDAIMSQPAGQDGVLSLGEQVQLEEVPDGVRGTNQGQ